MKQEEATKVYLDGKLLTSVNDPKSFANEIRQNRRNGLLPNEVNIVYLKSINEVHINSDRGRVRKPYIIVENGKSRLNDELKQKIKAKEIDFNYLIRKGIIEYLDAEEEENIYAALDEKSITKHTTHLEIDPASNLGLTINASVFPEYNSIGRHPISANFMKQSQGMYLSNFNNRYDARAFVLYYPQMPLINSTAFRSLNLKKYSNGQNFVVALTTYYGFNMADAIVMNKSSIDRGLGRSVFFRSYNDEERRYPGEQKDHFKVPAPTTEGYLGENAYSKLGDDGLIEKELDINEGDVLIGKVSPPRFLEEQTSFDVGEERSRDNSVVLRSGEQGIVDNVMLTETSGATKLVKVKIRSIKVPQIGDKFASRHGQKGVVSLLLPQEDMPFSSNGIIPDLLLNPHSLPSRMTFGHMLEMLGGKAAALSGQYFDGTPFSSNGKERIEEYSKILGDFNFDKLGDEELYDGRTGKKFHAKIFQGVVYYNRLWHMVSLKLQVRSRGPVQILTHQPTEGKPRKGGLKFGELERDALVGHGASLLIKDRMLEQSDKSEIWVCKECGDIGYYDYIKRVPICLACNSTNNIEKVEISYAFKLLLDELKSLHVFPKLNINE
ncbi:MAG: DNA-directed RNA polymerase subunit B [Candidatus Marsarchaeota archaeon]|nr:DNA-directed RNA polymerase subunit B [Candidatus Marsarchaeota archaeon]MCL5094520.1 DNA-directed RNA polymerase subunit B [Candidatus Marsarchaeota archaeon]